METPADDKGMRTGSGGGAEQQSASKKRGRPCNSNAARERSRVKTLRRAFLELQNTLPAVPPDTKLSKLDVLVLATTYIAHLLRTLDASTTALERPAAAVLSSQGFMHPVKKWPMRSRLYAGILSSPDKLVSKDSDPTEEDD